MKTMREKHELEMEILKCELEIKRKMLENLTKQVPDTQNIYLLIYFIKFFFFL